MSNLYEQAEASLLRRQALPAEFGPEMVRPAYDGLSLANVAAQAVEWLAPDAPRLSELAPVGPVRPELLDEPSVTDAWQSWQGRGPINHVVIMLWDAMGYDQLKTAMMGGIAPNLARIIDTQQAFFMPITSVYPSTTTTALTSVATAHTPSQHGVMGTSVYLREIGSIVDFIGFKPALAPTSAPFLETQLNPDDLLPIPNIYRRLERMGVQAEIINYSIFKGSSISRFTSAGSEAGQQFYHGFLTPADGMSQLRRRLETNSEAGQRSFTYAYVSSIDSSAHRYGPLAPSYQAELAQLDFVLNRELIQPLAGRSDIALMLVADHGQRLVEQDKILRLDELPDLNRNFTVPYTGESRAGYLHLKNGSEQVVRNYIEQNFGEHFVVLDQAEATELGLFGPTGEQLGPECADRVGDLLLIPKGGWAARQPVTKQPYTYSMNGTHGGLSRAEMLIPFLAYRF